MTVFHTPGYLGSVLSMPFMQFTCLSSFPAFSDRCHKRPLPCRVRIHAFQSKYSINLSCFRYSLIRPHPITTQFAGFNGYSVNSHYSGYSQVLWAAQSLCRINGQWVKCVMTATLQTLPPLAWSSCDKIIN